MKKAKVLHDLRSLIDYIEEGRVQIESYQYYFDETTPVDDYAPTAGNERIHIEFSKVEEKLLGEL